MDNTNKAFIAILGLIIVIYLGILFIRDTGHEGEEGETVNGFEFNLVDGLWQTQWVRDATPYNLNFHYHPRDVEHIEILGQSGPAFNQPEVYITFDPDAANLSYTALSAGELSLSLANAFSLSPIAACTKNETDACSERPIVTCENDTVPIIYLKTGDDTRVEFETENCLVIEGRGQEQLKATERLLYAWYKIVPR